MAKHELLIRVEATMILNAAANTQIIMTMPVQRQLVTRSDYIMKEDLVNISVQRRTSMILTSTTPRPLE